MRKDVLLVAKPWLVLANLVTAAAGYFFATGGRLAPATFFPAMAGIALVVAAGCVANNCLDRDIDRDMDRTRGRALASGALPLRTGRRAALGLGLAGAAILLAGTNALTLAIVCLGLAVYVGLYTALLKRRTPYATLLGSLAGAAPPLAGYCAARGTFDLGAWLVLAIFSLWQIPHSHAIAIHRLDDYARAGIPVLPVVRGISVARTHLAWHVAAFVLAAVLPAVCGLAGPGYLAATLVCGGIWLFLAFRRPPDADPRRQAGQLSRFSIVVIVVQSLLLAVAGAGSLPPG